MRANKNVHTWVIELKWKIMEKLENYFSWIAERRKSDKTSDQGENQTEIAQAIEEQQLVRIRFGKLPVKIGVAVATVASLVYQLMPPWNSANRTANATGSWKSSSFSSKPFDWTYAKPTSFFFDPKKYLKNSDLESFCKPCKQKGQRSKANWKPINFKWNLKKKEPSQEKGIAIVK